MSHGICNVYNYCTSNDPGGTSVNYISCIFSRFLRYNASPGPGILLGELLGPAGLILFLKRPSHVTFVKREPAHLPVAGMCAFEDNGVCNIAFSAAFQDILIFHVVN